MNYDISKKIILEQIQDHIEKHKHYNWYKVPADIYEIESITLLDVKGISTFAPLAEFKKLKSVVFGTTNCSMTIDTLVGIEAATQLESLTFMCKTNIKSGIESLSKLHKLRELGFYNVVSQLPAELIAELSNLEFLSLSKENYQSIKTLPDKLVCLSLNFDSIEKLPDWNVVNSLTRLNLGMNTCKFENLNSLCCFPNLTDLKLNSAKSLKDISYISELKQLKTLEINFASIEDFTVLGGHPNLEVLKMRGTAIEDISDLFPNINLKTLYLEKTKLKSITGIKENLPQLELLWIWDTKVKDLSPLDGMITLKELDLTMLKPKSWDFIQNLSGLERLDLCKSSFSDTSLLLKLPNLKYLRIDGSAVDTNSEPYKLLNSIIAERNKN